MKVKELKEKYKNYTIELYGKPLSIQTIPFTHLPKGNLDDFTVVDFKIIQHEHEEKTFKFDKSIKTKKLNGFIEAYVK